MSNLLKYLIIAATIGLPCPAFADATARLQEFAREIKTLSGSFKQVVFDKSGRQTQENTGEMYFSRPGKFRWVYRQPYEQVLVSDGRKVWIYDADLEQVTIKRLDQSIGESPAALLAGNNDIDKHFHVKDAGNKDGVEWLDARPKRQDGTFANVRLGFRENVLVAMQLRDNFGQTTQLTFNNIRSNPPIGGDLFRFTPPKGVDVISDDN